MLFLCATVYEISLRCRCDSETLFFTLHYHNLKAQQDKEVVRLLFILYYAHLFSPSVYLSPTFSLSLSSLCLAI